MNNNTIGIIGQGFVGSALAKYINKLTDVVTYDIKEDQHAVNLEKSYEQIVKRCGIIYLCLPTPELPNKKCNTSIVEKACLLINKLASQQNKMPLVLIKSTLVPNTTNKIQSKCSSCILVTNPEFLTERTAYEDIKNADYHLLGVSDGPVRKLLSTYHKKIWPHSKCVFCTPSEAEMVKYTTNSFFSVKISFANAIRDLCISLNINYDEMIKVMQNVDANRVGLQHWQVPGHDGKRGYGGSCLPKDSRGMIELFKEQDIANDVLISSDNYNNEIRDLPLEDILCQTDSITGLLQLLKKTFILQQS